MAVMRPSSQLLSVGLRGRDFVKSDGGGLLRELDLLMLFIVLLDTPLC